MDLAEQRAVPQNAENSSLSGGEVTKSSGSTMPVRPSMHSTVNRYSANGATVRTRHAIGGVHRRNHFRVRSSGGILCECIYPNSASTRHDALARTPASGQAPGAKIATDHLGHPDVDQRLMPGMVAVKMRRIVPPHSLTGRIRPSRSRFTTGTKGIGTYPESKWPSKVC